MKNILSALAALFLIFSSAQGLAEEKEDFSKLGYHPTPVGRFDFEQDPFFSMIVQELKVMIIRFRDDEEHGIDRLKRWNNFCAVGYVLPERPVAESGNYHYLRGCFQNTHHWRNERGQAQGPAPCIFPR